MVARAVLPGVPVADEEPVVDQPVALPSPVASSAALRLVGRLARGRPPCEKTRRPAVAARPRGVHVERQAGHLLRLAAVERRCARPATIRSGWRGSRGLAVRRPSAAGSRRPRASVRRRSPAAVDRGEPEVGATLLASRSVVAHREGDQRPSGETCGSEIRSMASMSWTENGWVSVAPAGRARVSSRTRASDERMRGLPRPGAGRLVADRLSLSVSVQRVCGPTMPLHRPSRSEGRQGGPTWRSAKGSSI